MKQQLKRVLRRLLIPIAVAVVFVEQVLIRYLNVAMAAFARLPWIERLEAWLVTLPPYGALVCFVLPSILILPIKVIAVAFAAYGKYGLAAVTVIVGKLVGTAVLARLYRILRPKLMSIAWFAWGDTHFFRWRDRAYAFVQSLPGWLAAKALVERARAWLAGLVSGLFAR